MTFASLLFRHAARSMYVRTLTPVQLHLDERPAALPNDNCRISNLIHQSVNSKVIHLPWWMSDFLDSERKLLYNGGVDQHARERSALFYDSHGIQSFSYSTRTLASVFALIS
jgi:hypothetical protein